MYNSKEYNENNILINNATVIKISFRKLTFQVIVLSL